MIGNHEHGANPETGDHDETDAHNDVHTANQTDDQTDDPTAKYAASEAGDQTDEHIIIVCRANAWVGGGRVVVAFGFRAQTQQH